MRKEAVATGKTIEEAVETACSALGVEQERVEVEILESPKKGFLGFKVVPAKVRVFYEYTKLEHALDFMKQVFSDMGNLDIQIHLDKQEESLAEISLTGADVGVVIGRRGETLDALQYLTGLVVNKEDGEYFRVSIDSGNYRQKRVKTLQDLARRLANNAVRTGKSSTLEPMNPYERRIIHATVQAVAGASSHSVGEEPNRRVVITSIAGPAKKSSPAEAHKRSEGGYRRPYKKTPYASRSVTEGLRTVSGGRKLPMENSDSTEELYSRIDTENE